MPGIPPGNSLRPRLSGMLVTNVVYYAGECWDLLGIPNFLKAVCITLLGESALTCWLTLWGIKISSYVLQPNLPWYLGGWSN